MDRSEVMRRVKSANTRPELRVRQLLRAAGLTGYRLQRTDLPGKPDIAFIGRRRAIFVHGCFWHGHGCRRGARAPRTNAAYWTAKIARNQARDAAALAALESTGWGVLVVWECSLRDPAGLSALLAEFVNHKTAGSRETPIDDPPIKPTARKPTSRRPSTRKRAPL